MPKVLPPLCHVSRSGVGIVLGKKTSGNIGLQMPILAYRLLIFLSVIFSIRDLGWTFKDHQVQPLCHVLNKKMLLRALSKLTLNVSRDGAVTNSLGILCQYFTTTIIKKLLLTWMFHQPELFVCSEVVLVLKLILFFSSLSSELMRKSAVGC